jgi:hypothetical protein
VAITNIEVRAQDAYQFQGLFKKIWLVSFDNNPASLPADGYIVENFPVPGVRKGDIVLGHGGFAPGVNISLGRVVHYFAVTDDDQITWIAVQNYSTGSTDLDPAKWTLVLARPAQIQHEDVPA